MCCACVDSVEFMEKCEIFPFSFKLSYHNKYKSYLRYDQDVE